jgi:hypothetical protein
MTPKDEELVALAKDVSEWVSMAERLGPAQRRVIIGLSAQWGPSPCHQTAKRMWMGITGRGIRRARGPLYVIEHKHRSDNCWRLNDNGLRLQVALWHVTAALRTRTTGDDKP